MIECHRLNSLSVKVFAMDAFPISYQNISKEDVGVLLTMQNFIFKL